MPDPTSSTKLVTVFGGSGFIGRYVVQALAKRGYRIRVAVRRPGSRRPCAAARHGRADQADPGEPPLSLVGRSRSRRRRRGGQPRRHSGRRRRQTFDAVQAFGPRAIGEAARAAGISNVVHISAIGADQPSTIGYLRSKAEGEAGHPRDRAGRRHRAAVDRVRAGGRFLQPLRGDGADVPCPAADRRRQHALPAGICRRRRARRSRARSTARPGPARSTSSAGLRY